MIDATQTKPATRTINMVRPVLPRLDELEPGLQRILDTGMVTKGEHLREFEEAAAEHLGVAHAVGVSSCTTGLMLTYRGLGLQGEVVVPSFTFMASVSSLVWAGLTPVFADVNPETATLDPEAAEAAITPRTSAIVGVHTFGNPADIEALEGVARRHNLKLIFDAAHGLGTLYNRAPVGSQGNAQSFSLSPTKLVIAGEGGIVATEDGDLAERIRIGREYGNSGAYDSAFAGMNARMPEFNALMGRLSLSRVDEAADHRNEVAAQFRERLGKMPGIGFQSIRPQDRCSFKDFSITIDEGRFGLSRDELSTRLREAGVDTRAYYDPPVHKHTAYRQFAAGAQLPNTDLLARESLSLPIWSDMDGETVDYIVNAVEAVWKSGAREQTAAST